MKNILLYLSAFVPMYALILIKQVIELLVGNIKLNFLDIFVIILLMTVIILGFIGLKLEMIRKKQTVKVIRVIEKTNTTDEHFLGYFSTTVTTSMI